MGRKRLSHWRFAILDVTVTLGKLLVVSGSNFVNSSLAVQSLSDCFIGLNELIEFLCQLIILARNDPYVIVERINFNLEVGIVI